MDGCFSDPYSLNVASDKVTDAQMRQAFTTYLVSETLVQVDFTPSISQGSIRQRYIMIPKAPIPSGLTTIASKVII